MKFKTKAALKLAKLAKIDLASRTLDDITLHFLDGDELVEGIEVFEVNNNGEYIVAPDGKYSWDNKTVVISEGIVESITESGSSPGKKSNAKSNNSAKSTFRQSKKCRKKIRKKLRTRKKRQTTPHSQHPVKSVP